MRKTIFCLMMALAAPAQAQMPVLGGSNIGLTQYPAPSCTKPVLPVRPDAKAAQTTDGAAIDRFNALVRHYNEDSAAYNIAIKNFNDCMHAYVENGNADMQRIKQKLDESVAAANAR